jgi:hypothetical protein
MRGGSAAPQPEYRQHQARKRYQRPCYLIGVVLGHGAAADGAEPLQRKDGSDDDDRYSRGDEQAVLHEILLLPAAGARTSTGKRAERMLASGMRITPVRTTTVA